MKRIGLEYYSRYYSVYPGIVVDNKDPDQRGRIKISIPNIIGTANNGTHPKWVPLHHANIAGNKTGEFFPPYIGDIVDVMFEHGDINYPIYKGGSWSKGELPDDFVSGYPNVRGWVFKSGQKFIVDETENKLKIKFANPSGSQIIIDDETKTVTISDNVQDLIQLADGKITIKDKNGDSVLINNGNITIQNSSGDQAVIASGKASITASTEIDLLTKKVVLGQDAMSGALGEPLQAWNDAHFHLSSAPGAPTSPPVVPGSAMAGTPLDYKALFIKMKGNQ